MTYLDNHPQLNGNQVGWFKGYWPIPFLLAILVIVGTPIYLTIQSHSKNNRSNVKTPKLSVMK